jgi:hypothetical protein
LVGRSGIDAGGDIQCAAVSSEVAAAPPAA